MTRDTFLDRVAAAALDAGLGCWEWTGAIGSTGYGRHGQSSYAHRTAYELFVGPIPDGLFVLHHCDNKRCVRPSHLYAGTHQDKARLLDAQRLFNAKPMTDAEAQAVCPHHHATCDSCGSGLTGLPETRTTTSTTLDVERLRKIANAARYWETAERAWRDWEGDRAIEYGLARRLDKAEVALRAALVDLSEIVV